IAEYLLRQSSHQYVIPRTEARRHIGADVVPEVPMEVEEAMWALYSLYEDALDLTTPFQARAEVGIGQTHTGEYPRAVLESATNDGLVSHVFRTRKVITVVQVPQQNGLVAPGVTE